MDAVIKGFEYGLGGTLGFFATCLIFSFLAGALLSRGN
jgi:hypothetical protein